ncbi:hypothetical protein C8R45DRAFT_1222605 [Mycena sanguinolenta]|nr:hypothetical protein C8R45DRAFT_1222605 [Mycena sanguinolenta]
MAPLLRTSAENAYCLLSALQMSWKSCNAVGWGRHEKRDLTLFRRDRHRASGDASSAQRLKLLKASAEAQGNLDPYISFQLTNFVASKKRADAAISGSHEEIMSLFDDPGNISPAHLRSLLPVPYSVLNPARIPEILAQFDSSGWRSIRHYIFQAHTCMRSLLVLFSSEAVPVGASVDLWEAVWPWIAFLDEYEQSLSLGKDSISAEAPNSYKRYLALIRYLEKDETARRLIHSTAGLYVVVGRAWPHLIHADAEALYNVSHFLAQWFGPDQWSAAAYEDLIVGCGGSRMDLATLVVSQIQRMLPRPDTTVTQSTVLHLVGIVCIVYGATISKGHEPDPALDDALLSCGIVTALTTASRALCRCNLDIAETVALCTISHHHQSLLVVLLLPTTA